MLPKAQYYNLTSTNEKVWPNIQQKALHIRQISNKKYGVIDKCTAKCTVVQTNVRQKVRFYRQNTLDQMYGVIDKCTAKCTVVQTNVRPKVRWYRQMYDKKYGFIDKIHSTKCTVLQTKYTRPNVQCYRQMYDQMYNQCGNTCADPYSLFSKIHSLPYCYAFLLRFRT